MDFFFCPSLLLVLIFLLQEGTHTVQRVAPATGSI